MRTLFVFAAMVFSSALKAQTVLPVTFMDYAQRQSFINDTYFNDSISGKKWFLTKSTAISTSFNFFKGGRAIAMAVPLGLQLNRRLNDNLYAFTGIFVAPAYINFNHSFMSADINKLYPTNTFLKSNRFGMYSRAELGLMYINDAKTFSISGSIGVEKSSYPMFPYQQINTFTPNTVVSPHR
jgi:hypothetical protein